MGYFQVRYDSRVVNYNRRGFIVLATDFNHSEIPIQFNRAVMVEVVHLLYYLEMI